MIVAIKRLREGRDIDDWIVCQFFQKVQDPDVPTSYYDAVCQLGYLSHLEEEFECALIGVGEED